MAFLLLAYAARRRAMAAMASALLGGAALLAAPQAGAADTPAPGARSPLRVVASFSILGDMVRQIGGADVQVDTLVGPDGDAHEYEPTPDDARALGRAQLLVVNGLSFESWMARLVRASGFNGMTVVASQGVQPRDFGDDEVAAHDAGHGDHAGGAGAQADPHAWQNLRNGAIYARNIGAALARVDPPHAENYRKRTDAYVARIEALDKKVRQALGALPDQRRRVVTSHDAFGYFGQAYGMTFLSTMGISTDAEPSAGDVARIISQVRREHVPAVFLENVSNPNLGKQIARETDSHLGGTLYSDALARAGQPASTYLGMFEWNLAQFMAALKP